MEIARGGRINKCKTHTHHHFSHAKALATPLQLPPLHYNLSSSIATPCPPLQPLALPSQSLTIPLPCLSPLHDHLSLLHYNLPPLPCNLSLPRYDPHPSITTSHLPTASSCSSSPLPPLLLLPLPSFPFILLSFSLSLPSLRMGRSERTDPTSKHANTLTR